MGNHINKRIINGFECHRRRDGWSAVDAEGKTLYRCQFLSELTAWCNNPTLPPPAAPVAPAEAPAVPPEPPAPTPETEAVVESAPVQAPQAEPEAPAPKRRPGNPSLGQRYLVGPRWCTDPTPYSKKKPAFFYAIEQAKKTGEAQVVIDTMAGREAVACEWYAEASGAFKVSAVWRNGQPVAVPPEKQKIMRFYTPRKPQAPSEAQLSLLKEKATHV